MEYVKIVDKNGKFRNWMIEDETDEFYKVFCMGQVASIYKSKCSVFNGKLISYEVLNVNDYKDELVCDKTTGSEQCSICFREVYSISRLCVTEDDKYICKKCAKVHGLDVKPARNL
jgi:hypothetical protein